MVNGSVSLMDNGLVRIEASRYNSFVVVLGDGSNARITYDFNFLVIISLI